MGMKLGKFAPPCFGNEGSNRGGVKKSSVLSRNGRSSSYRSYIIVDDELSPSEPSRIRPKEVTNMLLHQPDVTIPARGRAAHQKADQHGPEVQVIDSPFQENLIEADKLHTSNDQRRTTQLYRGTSLELNNLHEFLGINRWTSSDLAFIDSMTGRRFTYDELRILVSRVSGGLRLAGFHHGHVMFIQASNSPDAIVAFLATVTLGGSVIFGDPAWNSDIYYNYLMRFRPRFVVTSPAFLEPSLLAMRCNSYIMVYSLGETTRCPIFADLLANDEASRYSRHDGQSDDIAIKVIHGDSHCPVERNDDDTRRPIAVTQQNIVSNLRQIRDSEHFNWENGSRVLVAIPFHHQFSLVGTVLWSLYRGMTLVTVPQWDLRRVLDVFKSITIDVAPILSGWTGVIATNPMASKNGNLPRQLVVVGSSPFPECRHTARLQRNGIKKITIVYASSESTAVIATGSYDGRKEKCGKPLPGIKVKIVDTESGNMCADETKGEIYVSGPQIVEAKHNPELVGLRVIDDDGWLSTGDVGTLDSNGFLVVDGRADDIVCVNGKQVCIRQIEDIFLRHPAVSEVAVVASPAIKAFCVRKRGYPDVSPDEVAKFVNTVLHPSIQVSMVMFLQTLPKTSCGRLMRRAVLDQQRIRRGSTDRMQ